MDYTIYIAITLIACVAFGIPAFCMLTGFWEKRIAFNRYAYFDEATRKLRRTSHIQLGSACAITSLCALFSLLTFMAIFSGAFALAAGLDVVSRFLGIAGIFAFLYWLGAQKLKGFSFIRADKAQMEQEKKR